MAGKGPPPNTTKRRTNGTQLEAVTHEPFARPKLPRRYKVTVWVKGEPLDRTLTYTAATRAWWDAWARSPLTGEWAEVHWLRLLAVAKLKDRYERDPSPANAAELRQQEAAFGGSPADLRRLGRTVTVADVAPAGEEDDVPAGVSDIRSARRRRVAGG